MGLQCSLFVGERVTLQGTRTGSGFLDGNSITAKLVTHMFEYMSAWETTFGPSSNFTMPFFCFNNLYNCLQLHDLWAATVSNQLCIAQPIVTDVHRIFFKNGA